MERQKLKQDILEGRKTDTVVDRKYSLWGNRAGQEPNVQ